MTETLNPNHCWLQLEKLDPLSCLLTWVGIPMATQSKQKLNYGVYIRFLEHMSPDCSLLKNAFFLLVFMMPCFSNFSPSCLITTSQTLLLAFHPPPGVLSMAFSLYTLCPDYFHYPHNLENFSETPKSISQCWRSLHIHLLAYMNTWAFHELRSPWKWARYLICEDCLLCGPAVRGYGVNPCGVCNGANERGWKGAGSPISGEVWNGGGPWKVHFRTHMGIVIK